MNWRKSLRVVLLVSLLMVTSAYIQSCSQNKSLNPELVSTHHVYHITVVENGIPIPGATVIGIFDNKNDTLTVCDEQGEVTLNTGRSLTTVCGASTGLSGVVNVQIDGEVRISLEKVSVLPDEIGLPKSATTYWFGVHDTDIHGDVRFRYLYNFSYFYCSSWLPSWPFGDPNPNHWTSWNLTDFPYPWKGKKLLVPTRYQWWHKVVYGYSISRALFLIATS